MLRICVLILLVANLMACQIMHTREPLKSKQAIPKKIMQLVQRRQVCLQLQLKYANEKVVTAAEQVFLQSCDNQTLARQFRMMREKYQHNRAATDMLDSYADFD